MDERPFYELDDEELIVAEATEAALSTARPTRALTTGVSSPPGLLLRGSVDLAALERLQSMAGQTRMMTIIDHAQLVNTCACVLDRSDTDRFGLQALLRHEIGLLQLDRIAPGDRPRTQTGVDTQLAIEALCHATPSDRGTVPDGLARRLSPSELLGLAPLAEEPNRFLAMRRLSLALLPTLTRLDITADVIQEYTFELRIFINALAARWTLLPWSDLRSYSAEEADSAARAVIKALRHELDER